MLIDDVDVAFNGPLRQRQFSGDSGIIEPLRKQPEHILLPACKSVNIRPLPTLLQLSGGAYNCINQNFDPISLSANEIYDRIERFLKTRSWRNIANPPAHR